MATPKENATIISLQKAFEIAMQDLPETGAWLYLPDVEENPSLATECFFSDSLDSADPDEDDGFLVQGRLFHPTLDLNTIQECVDWADNLAGKEDDAAVLEVFNFYCRFDAFPGKLDAPAPPPFEESQRIQDLAWYDKLGPESASQNCAHPGCDRGAVRFSVLCRPHHFEMIMKRPSPCSH